MQMGYQLKEKESTGRSGTSGRVQYLKSSSSSQKSWTLEIIFSLGTYSDFGMVTSLITDNPNGFTSSLQILSNSFLEDSLVNDVSTEGAKHLPGLPLVLWQDSKTWEWFLCTKWSSILCRIVLMTGRRKWPTQKCLPPNCGVEIHHQNLNSPQLSGPVGKYL